MKTPANKAESMGEEEMGLSRDHAHTASDGQGNPTLADIDAVNFRTYIRVFRLFAKLSLQKAADEIGCTKAHLWDLEMGHTRNPGIALLDGISRAYGLPISTLAEKAALAWRDGVGRAPRPPVNADDGPGTTTEKAPQ